jgi:CO/xanthine dehydrogenase Mo-binding subunit
MPMTPGVTLAAQSGNLPRDLRNNRMLDSWIKLNADGTVTVMIGKVELGQGILTAFAQIVAEELDVNLSRLNFVSGDTRRSPNQGTTAGSSSMASGGRSLQLAAAEVRQILIRMAANSLGVPADELTIEDGTVRAADGSETTFWEILSGQDLHREASGKVTPKSPGDYRIIGRSVTRLDIPPMMLGEPVFLHDLRPAGMVYGQVVRPPTYKASLVAVDTSISKAMPGVLAVVHDGSFLGVVAERQEQAEAAAAALARAAEWNIEADLPGDASFHEWLLQQDTRDVTHKNAVRTDGIQPVSEMEATYVRPFHMHASLGTSAAIATMSKSGTLTIQTHSQSVWATAMAIAQMLRMKPEDVHCQHVQGSGCYGHNLADDAAADAALLAAVLPDRPVRLQYTREQEHRWEPFGSGMVVKTKASLDGDGNVLDWDLRVWSTPHGTRPGGRASNLLPALYLSTPFEQRTPGPAGPPNYSSARNAIAPYNFAGHRVVDKFVPQMPVRVSSLRSLGAYANVFAHESFIDELAHNAGADPLEYRLRFLSDDRQREVLQAAAEKFGWGSFERRQGYGHGIAYARYKNYAAMCAAAVEVKVNRRNGRVQIVRAVVSVDAGQMVNPDGVANQIEGGFIQALSWTMKEEVRFDTTRITSEDWASYPVLTFSEVPPVDVVLIDRPGQPFLGTGEACCGQTAAAVTNAIFDATGVRLRRLPCTPARMLEGLRV